MRRGFLAAALALAALLAHAGAAPAAPPIKHVFIVILENEDADSTFGPASKAPYLAHTLRAQGAFVPGFYATGHLSLDNYVSMVSGQGPNPYTQADAPLFINFVPGTPAANGQYIGQGSVYPSQVKTIADQLDAAGRTWHGYMEDQANSTTGEPKTCRHPPVNGQDHTQEARVGDQYATRHNPFMYFHSIIDTQARCDANVVDLRALPADLNSKATTRNYNFITPNLCHDGHDEPCVDGQPGGLESMNVFLKQWIPKILASKAYRDDGLVIITFDEAEVHDADACCGEQQGPNTPNNGGPTPGAGGGRVGAVLLSPFIKPGTVSGQQYNHYSMLRSTEDLFGLAHLGYAGVNGLRPFGADIFTNPTGTQLPPVKRPTVQLTFSRSLSPCTRTRFYATADATGRDPRIVIKRDGVALASKRGKHLTTRIDVQKLQPGTHFVNATVTDAFGRRAIKRLPFERCARTQPDPDD
jgi:phosphatidylinositol-3-phosphatase